MLLFLTTLSFFVRKPVSSHFPHFIFSWKSLKRNKAQSTRHTSTDQTNTYDCFLFDSSMNLSIRNHRRSRNLLIGQKIKKWLFVLGESICCIEYFVNNVSPQEVHTTSQVGGGLPRVLSIRETLPFEQKLWIVNFRSLQRKVKHRVTTRY